MTSKEKMDENAFANGIINAVVQGEKEIFNQVFFYGDPVSVRMKIDKLEKKYRDAYPEKLIVRTNGVDFCSGFICSVIAGTRDAFEKAFRAADMFIFEGFEVLSGRQGAEELFYTLFDVIYENGGQIVVGAATKPRDMPSLMPRIRTQLEGGIISCVDPPRREHIDK